MGGRYPGTAPDEEDITGTVKIGEEVTHKIDYIPGRLEIVEYIWPKYARPAAQQMDQQAILMAESS